MKKTLLRFMQLQINRYLMQPAFPFLIAFLFCISCGPDEPDPKEQLPPATQEGLNTFGCLVNGDMWVPRAVISNELTFYYDEGTLNIAAYRKIGRKSINQGIGIRIEKALHIPEEFLLSDYKIAGASYVDINESCNYETTSEQAGLLEITKLDTINHIVSGTFEFTVWTEGCDTIRVTDGRFDLKYLQ